MGEVLSATEIDRHLGRRILEARTERERDRGDIARIIDSDVATVEAMEAGRVRVASIALARISRALDLPLSWFFDGLPGQDVFDSDRRERRSV